MRPKNGGGRIAAKGNDPIVETRDLLVFIGVANNGSFRGAALALGLEPSVVSRRIAKLEDELGASLFERSRSGVRLTNAGRQFYGDTCATMKNLDLAVRSLSAAGYAKNGEIAVGLIGSLSSQFLGQLLRRYRSTFPDVSLTLREGDPAEHLAAIADRSLDVAFLPGANCFGSHASETLWFEPVVAALESSDHRASQDKLSLADLKDDKFIVSQDSAGLEIYDILISKLAFPSFHPNISRVKVSREILLMMVGLGFGISLVCASEMRLSYPQVTFVPLNGEVIQFSGVWAAQNDNPALRRFLSLARDPALVTRGDAV